MHVTGGSSHPALFEGVTSVQSATMSLKKVKRNRSFRTNKKPKVLSTVWYTCIERTSHKLQESTTTIC